MFSYLDDIDQTLPLIEQKKAALTRRANKFIEWLHRDFYTVYVDNQSTDELGKLIDRIVDVLGASVPNEDWQPFSVLFKETMLLLYGVSDKKVLRVATEDADGHAQAIESLLTILESYKLYVSEMK